MKPLPTLPPKLALKPLKKFKTLKLFSLCAFISLTACQPSSSSEDNPITPSPTPPTPTTFALTLKAPTAKVLTTNDAGNIEFQLEATGDLAAGESYALTLSTNAGALSRTLLQTNLSAASLSAGKWSYATNANYAGLPEGRYGWRLIYSNTKGEAKGGGPVVTNEGRFTFRHPPQAVSSLGAATLERKTKGSTVPVQLFWTEPVLKVTNSGYQVFWGTAGSLKNIGSNLPAGTSNVVVQGMAGADYAYRVVATNALGASHYAASSTESYTVSSFFAVKFKAPKEKYITTNAAGNIVFELESEGDLAAGEIYMVIFSTNAGSLSKPLLQSSLTADSFSGGKWSYATNANYAGLPEGEYGWRLEYAGLTVASPPVATSGSFAFRYPPQAVTGLRAETLETNSGGASGSATPVRLSWTEPALKVTSSGYQVFWGTGGSLKNIGSNLPAGTSNVVVQGMAGADYAYRVVATNALGASHYAASSTENYTIVKVVYALQGAISLKAETTNFYGEASPVTLTWAVQAGANHEAQEVWYGERADRLTKVATLSKTARQATISPTVSGSPTVYFQLRGKLGEAAASSASKSATLYSCGAPQNGFAMVCSRYALEQINAKGLEANYKLQNDIDLGGKEYSQPIIAPATNDSGGNRYYFGGIFDGNGKMIKNGTINGRNAVAALGLFGGIGPTRISNAVVVRNLGLQITVKNGTDRVGSLVGEINGLRGADPRYLPTVISNVYSTGDVSGTSTFGEGGIGGLVGFNFRGVISNAYATGAVTGTASVGGLVGRLGGKGVVSHSYATGVVSGSYNVGGLVGVNNQSRVANTYATGAVRGGNSTGGLVGAIFFSEGVTTNGYATGAVTRTSGTANTFGRVVGELLAGGSTTNLYSSTAGAPFADATDPGAPTAVDFNALTAGNVGVRFPTFDFANIWKWSSRLERPVLQGMPPGAEE